MRLGLAAENLSHQTGWRLTSLVTGYLVIVMKKCSRCKIEKPRIKFSTRKNGAINSRCKPCRAYEERMRRRAKGVMPPKRKDLSASEKLCLKCGTAKPLNDFAKDRNCSDGRIARCKVCKATEAKHYRTNNPDTVKATELSRDRTKRNKKQREYNSRPSTRKKTREYCREKYKSDPIFIATNRVHSLLTRTLRATTGSKNGRTYNVLGYRPEDLRAHLESLFLPGMNWDNRGEWHIDHIKPIAQFLKEGVSDPAIINALSNLQPLWAKDNLSKGAKWDDNQERSFFDK